MRDCPRVNYIGSLLLLTRVLATDIAAYAINE